MKNTHSDLRAPWVSRLLLVAAALAAGCGAQTPSLDTLEVEDNSEALSASELECERTKRECLIAADCEPQARAACEEAFRACEEPARAEKKRVKEACKQERETCDEAAADEDAQHACHIAEYRCKLPVEPPEAVCRVDAKECRWAARTDTMTPPTDDTAEQACREQERECKDLLRGDREELPKPPHCPPGPPPVCEPQDMTEEMTAPAPLPLVSPDECERTKVDCLIAADCDPDARATCETAFRACREPIQAEKKRLHEQCHSARESCESQAADEAAKRACHLAEHECKLPVEPPEAVCKIAAHQCKWAAQDAAEQVADGGAPSGPSAAEEACREQERACVEEKRIPREDLPKPPKCGKAPKCMPAMMQP